MVDVTGFNDKTWLIGAGTFHSEALHVTERWTGADKDTMHYEAVMKDPKVMTKPWVFRTTIILREGTRLREYQMRGEQPRSSTLPGAFEERIALSEKVGQISP